MKNIKKIADQIVKLEKKYQETGDSALTSEIEKLISNLSLSDMLELDIYIQENYNLKK